MVWTTLALLSLVVLGGFISYYGDLQGRRWGKRRVSWFGMRPKHTAILITSLTGAFISLLSVVTVLLIAPPVRDVVLRGERAIEDNKQLIERDKLVAEKFKIDKEQLSSELKRDQQLVADTATSLAGKLTQLTEKQHELHRLQVKSVKVQVKLANTETHVTRLQGQEVVLERQKIVLERQNQHYSIFNNELAKQNYGLGQDNTRLMVRNADLVSKNDTLSTQNADLTKARKALFGTNNILLKDSQDLEQQNQQTQAQLETARVELDRIKAEYVQAQRNYETTYGVLAGQGSQWGLNYVAIRQGHIGVRVGSELARRSLDAHMSARAVREQLLQLLQDASTTAQHYGAAVGTNGRAVRIVSKLVPTLAGADEADEGDSLNALISNMEGHSQPVVVVARAFSNTLEGEQAPIELKAIDIDPVFVPGQVLATRHIDASRSDVEVQQAITQFLQTDVRAAAIKAGTIPQVDPSTGISEVGKVDPLALARLVSQARRMGGDITIRAIAASPTTSADPLDRQHLRLDLLRQ